jgi:hypothetical protein
MGADRANHQNQQENLHSAFPEKEDEEEKGQFRQHHDSLSHEKPVGPNGKQLQGHQPDAARDGEAQGGQQSIAFDTEDMAADEDAEAREMHGSQGNGNSPRSEPGSRDLGNPTFVPPPALSVARLDIFRADQVFDSDLGCLWMSGGPVAARRRRIRFWTD